MNVELQNQALSVWTEIYITLRTAKGPKKNGPVSGG
jgi:hypothetical protein